LAIILEVGHIIKNNKMGEACRVRGGSEKCVQNYDWKDRREGATRKTWTNVRITIKQAGRMWTGLIWLRTETGGRPLYIW
jgi:hypothetical protein